MRYEVGINLTLRTWSSLQKDEQMKILATVLTLVAASPVLAGNPLEYVPNDPVVVPMPRPAQPTEVVETHDWTGPLVGLVGAMSTFDTHTDTGHFFKWGSDRVNEGLSFGGGQLGGVIGYRHDFGSFVLGGELLGLAGSVSGTLHGEYPEWWCGGEGDLSFSIANQREARLTFGYDAGGGWLPYAAAGLAMADVSVAGHYGNYASANWATFSGQETMTGPVIALGVERLMGRNDQWSLRGEIAHTDFGAMETSDVSVWNGRYTSGPASVDVQSTSLRVMAIWGF